MTHPPANISALFGRPRLPNLTSLQHRLRILRGLIRKEEPCGVECAGGRKMSAGGTIWTTSLLEAASLWRLSPAADRKRSGAYERHLLDGAGGFIAGASR